MARTISEKQVLASVRTSILALRKSMSETEIRKELEAMLNEARHGE